MKVEGTSENLDKLEIIINDLDELKAAVAPDKPIVTMKINDMIDYTIDEVTGEAYRVYKNSAGKPIGKIIRIIPIYNPATLESVDWYTIDFDHGIGEFTVSEKDDITDDRLRDIALYKRECIQQELNNLSNQETRLRNRLSEIDALLKGD